MKARDLSYRIKLGIFIILGTILLTALVLYIGSNRYFLWRGKSISAIFKSVHGLKEGNAVRYSGVHVGTVREIEILSDSAVKVHMTVEQEALKFIKRDSKASIGTEGLIGSKYVRISPGSAHLAAVEPGYNLPTEEAVDLEELLTTVSQTSSNAQEITESLERITGRIENGDGALGALISDEQMEDRIRQTFYSFQETGKNATEFSEKMIGVAGSLKKTGEKAEEISENLSASSGKLIQTTDNLYEFSEKLTADTTNLGRLISDTMLVWQLEQDLEKIGRTADDLRETSCRVRNAWFIRLFSKRKK